MKKFILFITNILSYIIPVKKNYLLFLSTPDYADNAYAVFRYMLIHNKYKKFCFCWMLSDMNQSKLIEEDLSDLGISDIRIEYCIRKSIKGIFVSFRSRYIFNTCGLFTFIKFRQHDKRINMWHGMPIKRIFSDGPNGDITIATSDLFSPLMSKGLNIPKENVLVFGQPRNDLMFIPEESKYYDFKSKFKTIGIWMPTFRRTWIDTYNDGAFNEDGISFVDFTQLKDLNDLLLKNDSLLIIKLHPLDILQKKDIDSYSNIFIYYNHNFHNKDLYPLLGFCDYMLTDFSSVAIDFEILNRPIGFTLDNMEQYEKDRGLSIKDFPGTSLFSYDEMKSFICQVINGEYRGRDYGTLYNKYKDSKSTKRLLDYLGL